MLAAGGVQLGGWLYRTLWEGVAKVSLREEFYCRLLHIKSLLWNLSRGTSTALTHRGGVSQNLGYLFGVPNNGSIVFWGLHWGPLILGNCQVSKPRVEPHVATCYSVQNLDGYFWETSWPPRPYKRCIEPYLEGQGDLVSRLIMGMIGVSKWLIGVISILTRSS